MPALLEVHYGRGVEPGFSDCLRRLRRSRNRDVPGTDEWISCAGWRYYGLSAAGVRALDRLTKQIIESRVSVMDTHTVIPGFFDIVHARNRGAAFSMFADSNSPWRPFFLIGLSLAALVLVAGILRNASNDWTVPPPSACR